MGSVWREVLTLQLGHYSNFVGSHWWNIQDSNLYYDAEVKDPYCEISNNVLFREGQTQHGQTTYTPRLILLDLKGSLNSLKQEGVLYEGRQTEPTVTWEGGVSVHKEEPVKKNQFLRDLDRHDVSSHFTAVTRTLLPAAVTFTFDTAAYCIETRIHCKVQGLRV
uniref:Misato Segment II tubulin-like domain-containing protein n=1 Tax=Callorhinchus milii TaxID=7868 RepID=A0A4W3GFV1_CALMI